jgi:hypothetical protein
MTIKEYHGWIIISDVITDQFGQEFYTTRKYLYMTRKEAIKRFKEDIKSE